MPLPLHTSGERRTFVADGHDFATSLRSTKWRTPSGQVLVEGQTYLEEWQLAFRLIKARGLWSLLAYRGRWVIVSEAQEREGSDA